LTALGQDPRLASPISSFFGRSPQGPVQNLSQTEGRRRRLSFYSSPPWIANPAESTGRAGGCGSKRRDGKGRAMCHQMLVCFPWPLLLVHLSPFFSLPRCVWLRLVLALSLCRADVQYGSTVVAPELCCATGWPCCCTVQQLQLDPCGFRSLPSRAEKGRDVNCKATLPSARALPCLSLLVTNTTKRWDRCWSLVGHSSVPRLQRSPAPQLVLSAQPSTRQLALPDQPGRSFEYAPLVTPERPLVVCPSSPPRGSL